MSYTETGFAPDATVDPQTGDVIVPPGPVPLVQILTIDGEYVLAVLSLGMDPDGNNLSERVKLRTILATDRSGLTAQINTCLVSDYGLTPDEAATIVPVELGTPPVAREAEHERARDETTGRYVAQEATWTQPAREA